MPITFTCVPSALGELVLAASDAALIALCFPIRRPGPGPAGRAGWIEDDGHGPAGDLLARARQQMTEYFGRTRTTFDKNPISIIVPCHRVVGATGELTGFGGGLDRKRWLLEHEGALMALGG